MSSLIPGVHVAMHTRAEILHTAAWMDSPTTCGRSFKQGAWSRRAAFGTLPSLSACRGGRLGTSGIAEVGLGRYP